MKKTDSEPLVPKPDRNFSVDIARTIACLGVIIIHIDPKTAAAQGMADYFSISCVPFFYFTSLCFFMNSINNEVSLQKSVKKLFPAYFLWNLLYIFIRLYKIEILHMDKFPLNITHAVFFGSSSEHLYFVPVLIFFQSLAFVLFHLFRRSEKLTPLLKLTFLGLLIATGIVAELQHVWGWSDIFTRGAIFLIGGYVLNRILKFRSVRFRAAICIFSLLCTCILLIRPNLLPPRMSFLIGFFESAFAISLTIQSRSKLLSVLPSLYFPVYLIHIFVLEIFTFFSRFALHSAFIFDIKWTILLSIIVYCISSALNYILMKSFSFYRSLF